MLTYQQASAIKAAMNEPERAVPFSRTFFRGGHAASKTISHKTAYALAKRGLGMVRPGVHKDEGIFVVVESGVTEYMRHKEKIMSENQETIAEDAAPTPKKARASNGKSKPVSSLNLMTHLSEEPEVLAVWPEDLELASDGPLFDRRQIEPLNIQVMNSIETKGMRVKPKVRRKPGEDDVLQVIDGRTRVRSAREINSRLEKAGLPKKKILVEVDICTSDAMAAELKHMYNEERLERDPLGKAEGMVELLGYGYSVTDVATMFKVSTKTVQRAKKLLGASDELKEALKENKITLVQALDFAKFPTDDQGKEIAEYLQALDQMDKDREEATKPSKGGKEEPAPAAGRPKKKRRSLPWAKVESIYRGITRHHFDDGKVRHTDADMAEAVKLAMNFLGGGGDKARKSFEEFMEGIGFGITPEEG